MSKPETKKGIGAFDFFCIGFGAIVGVGWAVSINKWMANSGGSLPACAGYFIALILVVPVALCYCELTPMLPVAGGGAAFAYKAFGEKISFLSGWAAFGAFVTLIPWEAIYICDIASILFPVLKSGDPLYTLAGGDIYLGNIVLGTICTVVFFWINWRGASASASVQRILCIILLAAGGIAIIASLGKYDVHNFQPVYENIGRGTHNSFFTGALSILATAPFFLCGFETIPQAVEDASGDLASVGKTVVLSVTLACLFYAILLFSLGSAMPWQQFFSDMKSPAAANLLQTVYQGGIGSALYYLIMIGALCGLLTTWNSFLMASPRLMMSLARANMIPKIFAKQHPVYGTPTTAMITCGVLSLAAPFLGMGLIDPLTSFSAAGYVLSWMITSFACAHLRKKEPNMHRPYRLPGGSKTAWFGGIFSAVVLIMLLIPGSPAYMGNLAVILFAAWYILGLVLYFVSAGERNAVPIAQREATLFAKMSEAPVSAPSK